MKRAYYSSELIHFITKDENTIFGEITSNDQFASDDLQKNTWKKEIDILKRELKDFKEGHLLFEYTIPRIGSRIDNVFLYKGIVFLLEFKVGETTYPKYAMEQVADYALDLSYFHKESHNKLLVPILVATGAERRTIETTKMKDNILEVTCCNEINLGRCITEISLIYSEKGFDYNLWINSLYMPTPTIIEAAKVLYNGHNVKEISRNDSSAKNLTETTKAINEIIEFSKKIIGNLFVLLQEFQEPEKL